MAQETPLTTMEVPSRPFLGILLGGGRIANHDGVGSPLIYGNYAVPLGLVAEFGSGAVRHRFSLHTIISGLNSRMLTTDLAKPSGAEQGYYAYGSFEYEYLHSLAYDDDDQFHFGIGGAWRNEVFGRRYSYDGNGYYTQNGSESGEGSSLLEAEGCVWTRIHGYGMIGATLALPLFGMLERPSYGYSSSPAALSLRSGPAFIGNMIGWQFSLEWTRDISYHLVSSVRYTNTYYSFHRDRWTSATLSNSFEGVLAWRF